MPPLKKIYPYVVYCILTGGIYYVLQLLVAGKVSASVMYPMISGGGEHYFLRLAGKSHSA